MYKAYFIVYKAQRKIAVESPNKPECISRVKRFPGRQWSRTLNVWLLPDTEANRKRFGLPLQYEENLTEETIFQIQQFIQWMKSKRYSDSTLKSYTDCIKVFFNYFKDKEAYKITHDDIVHFNNIYIIKRGLSAAYQNQFVNALKLFYRIAHKKEIDINLIHRPKTSRKLPRVLSKEEVKAILEGHDNIKHRTMLSLIYACGLRRAELLHLTFKDINRERLTLHVYQSKGKKDRIVPLSPKILKMLEEYYKVYKPKVWLFEGQKEGRQYSATSLQKVLKSALTKARISKPVTLHGLRHSYATHLLENGTDLRYIQELLGHNSSRTTEIYTHVSTKSIEKIKSPFDDL